MRPDQARRRREREQVVAPEQRLQHDVVEREREGSTEHEQRSLRALERELFPGSERDDDGDAEQRDPETQQAPGGELLEAHSDGEHERHRRGEGDNQGRDTGCGVLRTQVQKHVIPDDDDQPCCCDAHRISTSQAR